MKSIICCSHLFFHVDKFVNDVLPNHTDVSISRKDASSKYKLTEEEITYVHFILLCLCS